jgi:hypothetical protein
VAPRPGEVYAGLVGEWQAARTVFLRVVTSGRQLTLAQEHAAASVFLAAERRFVAAMGAAGWPAAARGAIEGLRRISVQMQSHLVAMVRTDSGSAFTERLADYSTDVSRDEAAVRAVESALGS